MGGRIKMKKGSFSKIKTIFSEYIHNPFQIIASILLVGLLVLTVFHFSSHQLLTKSAKEFVDSIVYYFRSIFSEEPIAKESASVLTFDENITRSVLPIDVEVFGYRFLSTFQIMVNPSFIKVSWNNFLIWLSKAANVVLLLAMPLFIIIFIYYNFIIFRAKEGEANEQSKPLQLFLLFQNKVYYPVKYYFIRQYQEIRYNKILFFSFLIIGLYNINAFNFFRVVFIFRFQHRFRFYLVFILQVFNLHFSAFTSVFLAILDYRFYSVNGIFKNQKRL